VTSPDEQPAFGHVLGAVYGVTPKGVTVDVPSANQRRLLGLLAMPAPRQLGAEWLADVLGVTAGALRTTVSRLHTTIGPATLRTTSNGYSLEGDVDASQLCQAVANAAKSCDTLGGDRSYSFGWFPATGAAMFNVREVVGHNWDVSIPLDDFRDHRAFGPEVAVPVSEPIIDRLVGLLGRQP